MSSTSTFAAILVGGSVGALAALWSSPQQPEPSPQNAALPFAPVSNQSADQSDAALSAPSDNPVETPAVTASKGENRKPQQPTSDSKTEAKNDQEAKVKRFLGLMPGPHDRTIRNKAALEKARVDCAEKIPDECMRAADAYEQGTVAYKNKEEAEQFRKVALSLYVKQCEKKNPTACYSLARMFHEGDLVSKSQEQVLALMERTHYLCEKSSEPICETLSEL